jgi:hypothetical protein
MTTSKGALPSAGGECLPGQSARIPSFPESGDIVKKARDPSSRVMKNVSLHAFSISCFTEKMSYYVLGSNSLIIFKKNILKNITNKLKFGCYWCSISE